jgi:hypothetical protein
MRLNAAAALLIGLAMLAAAIAIVATDALGPAVARLRGDPAALPSEIALPAWTEAAGAQLYRLALPPRD